MVTNFNNKVDNIEVFYKVNLDVDSSATIIYTINVSDLLRLNSKNYKSFYFFSIEQYDESNSSLMNSYSTKIIASTINPENSFILGEFNYPYKITNNSSLRIQMLSNTNILFNSITLYFGNNEQKIDSYLIQKMSKIDWTQSYFTKDLFVFKSQVFDSLHEIYYTIDSNQYNYIYRTDSILNMPHRISVFNSEFVMQFSSIGTYSFYSDSSLSHKVFEFPVVSKYFPQCNTPCEMLEALCVFDKKTQIDSLKTLNTGCKIELDKYWLHIANNSEMAAKSLIKEYYNRVTIANKRYTSIKQGIYTDRGMCFILFGDPMNIQYLQDKEIWKYSNDSLDTDKMFTFEKQKGYQKSDYLLLNKDSKQMYFEHAILNWNNGKQFFLKN